MSKSEKDQVDLEVFKFLTDKSARLVSSKISQEKTRRISGNAEPSPAKIGLPIRLIIDGSDMLSSLAIYLLALRDLYNVLYLKLIQKFSQKSKAILVFKASAA